MIQSFKALGKMFNQENFVDVKKKGQQLNFLVNLSFFKNWLLNWT